MHKIGQSGRFLGRILRLLLKNGYLLIVNVLKPLAKSIFIPLGLTAAAAAAAAAATDAVGHKKMFESGITIVIISNEEMNNIMKIVNSLEESGLLIKGFSETIRNETKEQKYRFLSMLLGTLDASLLGNLSTGKNAIKAGEGTTRAGKGTVRAGQDF